MWVRDKRYSLVLGILLMSLYFFGGSCTTKNPNIGKVIYTQVPTQAISENDIVDQNFNYADGMKIAMAGISKSLQDIEVLTEDFQSARAPEVSYDGKLLIFSGQKNAGETWQIWMMDLADNSIRQVTQSTQNCTDPTWLPDGRLAYSKQIESENGLNYHALFSCMSDGSDEQQITYQPHEDLSASVIKDGRLLINSRQVYPDAGTIKYLAVHPDGTKAEVFYQSQTGSESMSKAWESTNDKIYFIEANQLISIRFNRPLHSRETIKNIGNEKFLSVFPMDNDQLLVSFKKPEEHTFGLAMLPTDNTMDVDFYYNNSDSHAVEPVIVMERPLPKKLPSTVNISMESGYFICMDANQSDIDVLDEKATKIQVLGINSVLGEAPVSEDGSFYVEIGADQPIRFQSLDDQGEVVRGPSSWMWVRPNERRGCVGCHEDRETAPENVVPKAIERAPFAMIK